jgi:hypothetical protein
VPREFDEKNTYGEQEAKRRFEAALRGARAAAAHPMKDIPPKRSVKRRKKKAPAPKPEPTD